MKDFIAEAVIINVLMKVTPWKNTSNYTCLAPDRVMTVLLGA